jgi:hypothetical protein
MALLCRNLTILSRRFRKIVITGFNTDIEFQGVTYHVQTEDKGLETPLILSLVYDRGTILASKRSPYNDLLKNEFNEKELSERLQRQHKLICAAVRAGRIEDLKQMTLKEAAAKRKAAAEREGKTPAEKEVKAAKEIRSPQPAGIQSKSNEIPPPPQLLDVLTTQVETEPALTTFSANLEDEAPALSNGHTNVLEIPMSVLEDLIIEEVQIIEETAVEEPIVLPVEAVQIISEEPKNEPVESTLNIELLNEAEFKSGERKTLSVMVKHGNAETGLSGAHVMVKVLGSSFRPLIFHAKTDSNGVAVVQLQLPRFTRGRAAILVKAMSGGEETELRRTISQD